MGCELLGPSREVAGSHALRGNPGPRRSASRAATFIAVLLLARAGAADSQPAFETQTLHGRVVYLAEAFEKQTGIAPVPEARERILALQTKTGELIPLFEDVRGRAFRRDDRLREMDLELVVRRYPQSSAVQIIRVIEVTKDGRFEIDYWCEICAIAMFEQKDCECCQGPVELRRRKVE
jgi:hypothetical protein